jgi:hypothetical protein
MMATPPLQGAPEKLRISVLFGLQPPVAPELAHWASSIHNGRRPLMSESTKLSSSTTVAKYRKLEETGDRKAIGQFFVERFDERYFRPIEDSSSKHGFAVLAVACLVIETLESFYQGRPDTIRASTQMFRDFLGRDTPLKVLAGGNDWFYKDIRCGILHQSESRGGWRVLRRGPLLDVQAKALNATAILRALRSEVRKYAQKIQTDELLWKNFCKKMGGVCANCAAQ